MLQAVSSRRKVGKSLDRGLVLPLHGGSGALLSRAASRKLITTVSSGDVDGGSGGIAGWLERRQARRSALLVVPDRPSGVAIALRLGLSPERLRLAGDFDISSSGGAGSEPATRRPWHSKG